MIRRIAPYIFAGFIMLMPAVVVAQLVPCGGPGQEACQFCHVAILIENILFFVIQISIAISAIMFGVAGYIWIMNSGNASQIEKARKIFSNVFIGLIIVIAAWLVIDTILKVMTDRDLNRPWAPIRSCEEQPSAGISADDDFRTRDGLNATIPDRDTLPDGYVTDTRNAIQKQEDERSLRQELGLLCDANDRCSISVNKSNCPPNTAYTDVGGGCTDISRLSANTLSIVESTARECGANEFAVTGSAEAQCAVTITGGSELGHAGDCSPGSITHCAGNKVDFSKRSGALIRYVESSDNFESGRCSDGRAGRIHKQNGSCWVDEGDHYDVLNS